MKKQYLNTVWELATYDVWGNAKDGYDVNDVYRGESVEIKLLVETANVGTMQEFKHASPTDSQIRQVFGIGKTAIDTDGDDTIIYVNRARDSYPIGELRLISHRSLSPISWERLED